MKSDKLTFVRCLRVAGVSALFSMIVSTAAAAPIMYLTTNDGSALATVDLATGIGTVIGPTGTSATYAASFGPDGRLYTLVNSYANAQLATLDLTTGAATVFGVPVGLSNFMMLEFSADGTLYGGNWGSTNSLYNVNPVTGAATLIGGMGISCAMDFAFSPSDVLFAVDSCSNSLYTLNTSTGAATLVAGISGAFNFMSLSFDGAGNLFGTEYAGGARTYQVNPATGVATLIGNTGLVFPHGGDIAVQAVPEPASMLLLGTGLAGFVAKARRRRKQDTHA
jgi:hypothetical protein